MEINPFFYYILLPDIVRRRKGNYWDAQLLSETVINPGHSQIHSLPGSRMFSWHRAKTIKKKSYFYLSILTEKKGEQKYKCLILCSKAVLKGSFLSAALCPMHRYFSFFPPIINRKCLSGRRKLRLSALVTLHMFLMSIWMPGFILIKADAQLVDHWLT